MNKILKIFLVTLLVFLNVGLSSTNATFFKASHSGDNNIEKQIQKIIKEAKEIAIEEEKISVLSDNEKIASGIKIKLLSSEKTITQEKLINDIADEVSGKIPKSYKYIKLNIRGVSSDSKIYSSLQKLVYLDLFPNKIFYFNKNKVLKNTEAEKIRVAIIWKKTTKEVKKVDLSFKKEVILLKTPEKVKINYRDSSKELKKKQKIFQSVYDTLLDSHYDKNNLTEIELLDWAIKWLAKGTGDKFTTYFPPLENKSFMETLDWKFEWIWSYVEMEKPWVLKIISPISGSPSEKAGIKWGDIITEVDWKKITEKVSLQEAISWIKGPKKTPVVLTVLRNKKIINITVIRDTIIIKNVEYKKINYKTFYIKLVNFWKNISWDFDEALVELEKNKWIKKIILDVRNNPGGYLSEVSKMLSHFVPKGKETVVVKYLKWNQNYYSTGKTIIDFDKYKIVILQNSGSASASEIFVWTIKDYFPKATVIWEKSYWKGSVQSVKPYSDGSSLKYTIAKWFTGKTQTWIDGVGIPVDIKLEFDFEKFKKTKIDNQLEKAKSLR